MLLRPAINELKGIAHGLGVFAVFLGFLSLLPVLVSLLSQEWAAALPLAQGAMVGLIFGLLLLIVCPEEPELTPAGAFSLAALIWAEATLLVGLTYYLSGHFLCFSDACFDAMSGFTTTGLVLIQDLDHAPEGLQFLRHGVTFLGGQGIVVLFLALAKQGSSLLYQLYVGEGKDERLWPNVLHTARSIWKISMIYLLIGVGMMAPLLYHLGMSPWRALLESLYLFEGAWSTGGFAPHTQNLLYYHSPAIEFVTTVFCILGSFNFLIHHFLLHARFADVFKDIEIRSMLLTGTVLTGLACVVCWSVDLYPTMEMAMRKAAYHVISAHTTTGNMTLYARQFYHDWPVTALMTVIAAMAIGGSACSTAGGIKGLRMGQLANTCLLETKRAVLPPSAVPVVRYHHGGTVLMSTDIGYKALYTAFFFVLLFALVTLAGIFAGYSPIDSLFEGVSAASNSGLSIGITSVTMPDWLKWAYIAAMWLGRLEFMAIAVLAAFLWSCVCGK